MLLVLGRFPARSFEELFQGTRAIAWEDYLPENAAFPVKGYSISSQLHSVPACQSIIKKAMVERMKAHYHREQFPEDGVKYQVRFSLFKDEAALCLDTSGEGLYKRGYRAVGVEAPLRETLAAAMVLLSRYRGKDPFCDPLLRLRHHSHRGGAHCQKPCAGAGPQLRRPAVGVPSGQGVDGCGGRGHGQGIPRPLRHLGRRHRPRAVAIARGQCPQGGGGGYDPLRGGGHERLPPGQHLRPVGDQSPYGERLMEKREAEDLYRELGQVWCRLPEGWRTLVLSSHTEFERSFGRPAAKKRKLYNGMIKCDLFMYGNV